MQTLHVGCSKAEPKNFCPVSDPFPGAQDGQNFIITYRSSLVKIHARNFELSWLQTHKQTNTETDGGDYNTLHILACSAIGWVV